MEWVGHSIERGHVVFGNEFRKRVSGKQKDGYKYGQTVGKSSSWPPGSSQVVGNREQWMCWNSWSGNTDTPVSSKDGLQCKLPGTGVWR